MVDVPFMFLIKMVEPFLLTCKQNLPKVDIVSFSLVSKLPCFKENKPYSVIILPCFMVDIM